MKTLELIEKERKQALGTLQRNYVPEKDFVLEKLLNYEDANYALATNGRVFLRRENGTYTGISEGRQNDIKKAISEGKVRFIS